MWPVASVPITVFVVHRAEVPGAPSSPSSRSLLLLLGLGAGVVGRLRAGALHGHDNVSGGDRAHHGAAGDASALSPRLWTSAWSRPKSPIPRSDMSEAYRSP